MSKLTQKLVMLYKYRLKINLTVHDAFFGKQTKHQNYFETIKKRTIKVNNSNATLINAKKNIKTTYTHTHTHVVYFIILAIKFLDMSTS